MFKLFARLVSRHQPVPALDSASESRLCQQFLPMVQKLGRQRQPGDPDNGLAHVSLRNEDSMNLYERAGLYLEFGQWSKALTLLEAAARRLHAYSPTAANDLVRLSRHMREAEHKLRELPG